MSFAQDNGYIPATVADLMNLVMQGVNDQFGTTYTTDTFLGTNFYKHFYALIQYLQQNEIQTSEIVEKLQQYFVVTNEQITRPNTTNPGILDYMRAHGYSKVSIKAPIDADAGKVYLCFDVDSAAPDYATTKLAINNLIKNCVVAGAITQGTEVSTITLSNQQSFDFKYNLPTKTPIKLKLTIVISSNNQYTILADADIKALLYANIMSRYHMGLYFEPQRYFSVQDAPWAATVLLQYSLDGGTTWVSTVAALAYNVVYTFAVSDITLVQS